MAKIPTDTQWQDLADRINSKGQIISARISGNSSSFTMDIPMMKGKSDGFIHQCALFLLGNNVPICFLCHWTRSKTYYQTKLGTDNTTMTMTLNSTSEINGTANFTFTFSRTIYGGLSVLAIV